LTRQSFLERYRVIRRGEGWGSPDAAYYHALPYAARSNPQREIWRVRAASFRALLRIAGENRRVLDLGAGNGWLAYQLSRRGHSVVAVDWSDDEFDGLGALCHYALTLDAYQADFAALPFADAQFDLIVFNAALHYARNLGDTFAESLRVLAPAGALVVMDSPMYHDAASGRAMLAEKDRNLKERFGLEMARDAMGFLTFDDFEKLARAFAMDWEWIEPFVDARWATRHWWARLRARREPARFGLMIGKRA
jgi:SAM-dependent methyltransferase